MNGKKRTVRALDKDFEKIYLEYYTPLYRYLLSLTGSSDMAEEITQETFFKALKNIEKYDPQQRMLTWLCTIAKNTYFSQLKKQNRLVELPERRPDDESDILERMIDSEESMELFKLLHKLDEPFKEVFTLRVIGSLSFKKIGEIFGKTEAWARVTYFRSKVMIKEKIKDEG